MEMVARLVELDIFPDGFERSVAGELLESGDMHALRDPLEIARAAERDR